MKLIVGLGNPGKEYENTHHNIGFMCIDSLANKYNVKFKAKPAFKGMIAEINNNGEKIILLKPTTYMNLSGESIILVKNFYKISIDDILIISDDLDSHVGRVRLRANGSAGGHNGHKSIALNLGTTEYKRCKVGIGRSDVIPVIEYVLQKFSTEDMDLITKAISEVCEACTQFIDGVDFQKLSSKFSKK